MSGANLLDKMGKKEEQAAGKSSEATKSDAIIGNSSGQVDNQRRGDDLLKLAQSESVTEVSTEETTPIVDQTTTVKDPDSWSKDSALKEVTKLREENKAVRLKFQEQIERIQKETETQILKIKEEAQSAWEAKKKLEAVEAEAADKKKSIEEKLADREAKLARTEETYKKQLEEKNKEVESYRSKALQYEAEQEAKKQVYRERIKEELDKVPTELREFAEKMVKGYEDPHEGWLAISEAHRKGMFGEKQVVVSHAIPGAANGARLSKTKTDDEANKTQNKKTPRDLIKSGLQKIKQGESNSAFRGR